MEYKIKETKAIQTKTGTPMAKLVLVNKNGEEFSNVTVFSTYTSKVVGDLINGDLTQDNYNGKTGWKFKGETTTSNFQKKADNFVKAIEKKEASIEKAQDRKGDMIKMMADQRDAVLIVTTFYKESFKLHTDEEMESSVKAKIKEWEKWLRNNIATSEPF